MQTFSISIVQTRGGRSTFGKANIQLPLTTSNSPFSLALQRMAELSKTHPMQGGLIHRLSSALKHLAVVMPTQLNVPISGYTRESFDDFLSSMELAIEKLQKADSEKLALWQVLRQILKRNLDCLGDGSDISSCISNYTGNLKKLATLKSTTSRLSAIPHADLHDLETKAIRITKKILDDVSKACETDIDEYLKVCRKQNNFCNYKLNKTVEKELANHSPYRDLRRLKKFRKTDVLKSTFQFLNAQETFKFTKGGHSEYCFPSSKALPILKSFDHYRSDASSQPWFFCQYRLPNYLLTSCFILLLIRTGWNIASVGSMGINEVKKTENGNFTIQTAKHRSNDDTPRFTVSKADKYLKICLSLLLWNNQQLKKFGIIKDADNNLWHGWQRSYDRPMYPLDHQRVKLFFSKHQLQEIPPSHFRPIKASFSFLKFRDIELIRMALGHSNLETTNLYLKNNLIFQLNESRILEFQRRFENTIAFYSNSKTDFEEKGFSFDKVIPSILKQPSKSQDAEELEFFRKSILFLESIGVNTNEPSIIITVESLTQVLLLKNYYRLRWKQIRERNPEYFSQHHINVILYIVVFLRIAKERKPYLVEATTSAISERVLKDD